MLGRYRCLVAVTCLAAFVFTLGLPWVGLSVCGIGTDAAPLEAPAGTSERPGDPSERPPAAPVRRSAPPRAPPLLR